MNAMAIKAVLEYLRARMDGNECIEDCLKCSHNCKLIVDDAIQLCEAHNTEWLKSEFGLL